MTEQQKTESTKGFHIQGIWAVVVAIVTLVVGFLLRPAVDNIGAPKYADIGGVWKAHADLVTYCEISTVNDTFYIGIFGRKESSGAWSVHGKGKLEKQSGSFSGEMRMGTDAPFVISGHAEMAGSDQLGITLFYDEKRNQPIRNYAFIRESSSSVEMPKDEKTQ